MKLRLPALALLLVVCSVAASAASAQPETTAPTLFIKVKVTITDSKIIVRPRQAPRGSNVQFMLRNVGKKTHVFTLGTAKRGVGLQTGFKQVVRPGQHKSLMMYLDYRGLLPYYGSTVGQPGKRRYGAFRIGEAVAGSFVG
ncbi:hypothetical protein [Gaiella sp.]|jgi:hypothetical protein|uniref:hypothetical protein n=1 Tax=Gaiella sp. TaxID=2663207 RepID=UPI002E322284|nr:hypothetical protein [Gaiella sp.]HEX5584067.1 hypothetical protein [Gaiella sp.]